jgi:hypothetical protein
MKTILAILSAFLALPASGANAIVRRASTKPARLVHVQRMPAGPSARRLAALKLQADSGGLGVNMPVIGRLVGNGNVLYKSALDVANYTSGSVAVAFFLDGVDLKSNGGPISVQGFFDFGGIASATEANPTVPGYANVHFDDFVDAVAQAGGLSPQEEADGFLGSMLVVFYFQTPQIVPGQGAAFARFYSSLDLAGGGSGTTGVAQKGHELTAQEPQSVVGVFRDTRGEPGVPQIYTNIFLNNEGYFDFQNSLTSDSVTVRLTAYSNQTGQQIGDTQDIEIGPFQTVVLPFVLDALNVPLNEDTVIVFADVISGSSDISGVAAQVDDATKDPSGFEMSPVY